MNHYCFGLLFFVMGFQLNAQDHMVRGRVVNNKLEPLSLVSVKVRNSPLGTITKQDGTYELKLDAGKYELVFTMVGFKPQIIPLVLNKDYTQNIILEEEATNLEEAVVSSKIRDRSVEIIRNVIRQKEAILKMPGNYSLKAYIKAVQEDSIIIQKKKNIKIPDSTWEKMMKNNLNSMAMSEILLQYDRNINKREKEERLGVKQRGNGQSLFYLSLTEADFNLYNNLLYTHSISAVPFISPVSGGGLAAYRYKLLSVVQTTNGKVYTISFKPRELSNVTLHGQLTVLDGSWVIIHANFQLPVYHLPEYDYFSVVQDYEFVNDKAWMITRQDFAYYSKHGKGKLNGRTVIRYTDFEFNKTFPPNHFGPELSSTSYDAYRQDSSFWKNSRKEPLTPKEIRYIQYSDSVFRVTSSKPYLDSIDRERNKITWKKMLITGHSFYNREKGRTWYIPSIPSIYQPLQFGGGRLRLSTFYSKLADSRKFTSVWADLSYGLRNKDLNGNVRVTRMYNPFNRAYYRIEAGRNFSYIFSGDAWINMLKRSNLYLKNSVGAGHGQEILNGLFLTTDLDLALRRSLADYKTNPDIDSTLSNILDNNQAIAFDSYNALYSRIRLSYTPAQKYIREPREKIIVGSSWPTFYVEWKKGIKGPFESVIDFDYLELGLQQTIQLATAGVSRYTVKSGSFLNKQDLRLVDYKFQRKGDPLLFMNPDEAFQSLDSTFAVFKRFYEGHYVHEFNGSLINRIPFIKKLQVKEVAGGGFLYTVERNLKYVELFAGLEKSFKSPFDKLQKFKVGVYIVTSAANKFSNPVQFKIGLTSWDKTRDRWY